MFSNLPTLVCSTPTSYLTKLGNIVTLKRLNEKHSTTEYKRLFENMIKLILIENSLDGQEVCT